MYAQEHLSNFAAWLKTKKNINLLNRYLMEQFPTVIYHYTPQIFILILSFIGFIVIFGFIVKWEQDAGRDRMANESDCLLLNTTSGS